MYSSWGPIGREQLIEIVCKDSCTKKSQKLVQTSRETIRFAISKPQSVLKPHDWNTCSKLFRPLLLHCFTISIGTLYSPLQFGVNTRCKRELIAFWERRTFPGSGFWYVPQIRNLIRLTPCPARSRCWPYCFTRSMCGLGACGSGGPCRRYQSRLQI